MIGSIQRTELRGVLQIPDQFDILLAIALGKPKETVVLEPVGPGGDIKYWRDENDVHHVSQRSLEEIII